MQHILAPNEGLEVKAVIEIRKQSPTAVPTVGAWNQAVHIVYKGTKSCDQSSGHLSSLKTSQMIGRQFY